MLKVFTPGERFSNCIIFRSVLRGAFFEMCYPYGPQDQWYTDAGGVTSPYFSSRAEVIKYLKDKLREEGYYPL